jgi:hypothetical protein
MCAEGNQSVRDEEENPQYVSTGERGRHDRVRCDVVPFVHLLAVFGEIFFDEKPVRGDELERS